MAVNRQEAARDRQRKPSAVGGADGRVWRGYALIVVACLIAMGPVLRAGFLSWDDYATISRNPDFNPPSLDGLLHNRHYEQIHLYVPVTYTAWWTLAGLSQLFGGDEQLPAALFHGANWLLHVLTSIVVWRVIELLVKDRRAALLGALLFAVHPLQVEAVAWASGLKDVLCALLIWTAVWQYIVFVRQSTDGRPAWRPYCFATSALLAGMLAKPTAIVTPLLVTALDTLVLRRPWRAVVRSAGPWFVLIVPCIVWTARVQPASSEVPQVAVWLRPLIALDALAFYLRKLAWPFGLTVDQGRRPDIVVAERWAYWTWVIPACAMAALAWLGTRARRGGWYDGTIAFAGAAAVISLGPLLGLKSFDFQRYSTVAEHYFYPAMVGPALLAAVLIAHWGGRPAVRGCAIALIVLLAVRSHVQAYLWKDSATLFAHAVEVNPRSFAAHNGLATWYVEAHDPARAIPEARRSIEIEPRNMPSWVTLGSALAATGDVPGAIAALRRALTLAPDDPTVHASLAGLLGRAGDHDGARRHAEIALKADPNQADAHLNLGTALYQEDQNERALEHLQAAVRLAPRNPIARTNLGFILLETGKRAEAAEQFEAALRADPRSDAARRGLAQARAAGR